LGGSSLGDEAIVKAELALTPLRSGGLPSRSASDPAESRVSQHRGLEHSIEVNAEGLALIRKDNVREFSLRAGANWTITFNRPKRRNCLTREVLLELEELLLRVGDDDDARVLILTGSGSAFSAGADISGGKNLEDSTERMKSFARDIKGFPRLNARVLETLMRLDALTIAAVNGFAVGACQCDGFCLCG
jgi:hypothetical protein